MTLYRPWAVQAAGGDTAVQHTGLDFRLATQSLWATEGVITGLGVTQRAAGANFSVDVAAGQAIITGNDVAVQGTYLVTSDAVVNVTVPSPPGSGTRTHRVIAYVKDKLYDGSLAANTYDFSIELQADTGSGTPALPASAITLATVSVSAGQASVLDANITQGYISALARPNRGRLVASSSARPPVPLTAEELFRTDTTVHEIWDGSAWQEMPHRGGGGSAWTTYTPSLTAVTTNPTLGTGSAREGAYMQIGKQVTVRANFKFGTSGAAAGSGIYRISLPVTSKTLSTGRHVGSCYAFDDSANDVLDGTCYVEIGQWGQVNLVLGGSLATNSVPWTWANNDAFGLTITYEAA